MDTNGTFGAWLKQRRKALDLTQGELADQVGCTLTTIQKIEANTRRPSKQIAERIADVLAIMPGERVTFMALARRRVDYSASPATQLAPPIPTSKPLVMPSTSFLGRIHELSEITDRLMDPTCRLLTLVGGGGIGKTRLALQGASEHREDFNDGVCFVPLAPVGSATLIAAAIASALQLPLHAHETLYLQVINYLRGKNLLLVLDNYEHLLPEITLLKDLLTHAPRLKILVTSRERLNIEDEWILEVKGLLVPPEPNIADIDAYSAVQLFIQTARRLQPDFMLEPNRNSVIEICNMVEGMPLGIELAASWLRAMPCDHLAKQIKHDLNFLTTSRRDIPDRHRSLRAVFDQSWNLLSDDERSILMKLSIFHGGIDPEAAQHIAQASLSLLASLVDKSLLRLNTTHRYDMHELLRQFASEKLRAANQTVQTQHHHLYYFVDLAEGLESKIFGREHIATLDRLELELNNFRSALNWALEMKEVEKGLRLASALGWFWNRRSYFREGIDWLESLSAQADNIPLSLRGKIVHHLLELSYESGDDKRLNVIHEEAILLIHSLGDSEAAGWLLCSMGIFAEADAERARLYLCDALTLFKKLDNEWGICETLVRLAGVTNIQGDFDQADKLRQEGIRRTRQSGEKSILAWLLYGGVRQAWSIGKVNRDAATVSEDCLSLFQELRQKSGIFMSLYLAGEVALYQGNNLQAKSYFEHSLVIGQEINTDKMCMSRSLIGLASVYSKSSRLEQAAQLLGAVDVLCQSIFNGLPAFESKVRSDFDRVVQVVRDLLDDNAFSTAYAQGQDMTLDQAVVVALAGANCSSEYTLNYSVS